MTGPFDFIIHTVQDLEVGQEFATDELGPDRWTVVNKKPSGELEVKSSGGRETVIPDNWLVYPNTEVYIYEG